MHGGKHAGLMRKLVGLARIAFDAGSHNVVPAGFAAFIAWQDMIEVKIFFGELLTAILAGIVITQKDIVASEFHLLTWQFVVECQHDDFRNLHRKAYGSDQG